LGEDYINEQLPWRMYIRLRWEDLDLNISLDLYIGDQIPNPPTHLQFTGVGHKDFGFKDINSKELDKKLNKQYKEKFEKEILDKLGVEWKREICW
jgi:hypothetical protein